MGRVIVMENLPKTATETEIVELLSDVGKVIWIKHNESGSNEIMKSFVVEMSTEDQARTVVALFDMEGIHVKFAS